MNNNYLYKIIKRFLDDIPFSVWIEDTSFRIVYLNQQYEKTFNVNYSDVKGKTNEEAFGKKIADVYEDQIRDCLNKSDIHVVQGNVNDGVFDCYILPLKENGEVVAVAGFIIDVSAKIRRQKEIENQQDILRTIIDALPESIFYKDKESRILGYNKKFEKYYNDRGITDIIGKNDMELYSDKKTAREFIEFDRKIISTRKSEYYEQEIIDEHGRRIEEIVKVPITDDKNNVWGIVGLARDITERKKMEDKLKQICEVDMLTKLYNRYSFEEKVKILDVEENMPLGIIMGDINGLKMVNDSLGHIEGDKLIISIAEVLRDVTNDRGYAFRWGGDEFVILLPNCDEDDYKSVIEKINKECNERKYDYFQLSIALAAEVKDNTNEDIYDSIKKVEEKVYRKKLLQRKSLKSSIIESLKASLEEKSVETREHTERVRRYAQEIGRMMKLKESEIDELMLAAELHDIGKIAINEDILLKKGRLTDEEFEIMKSHTEKGYRIVHASGNLENVAKCVLMHHERYDGRGYPLGLKGEAIPIIARIINIADSYDVMTHARVYKEPISKEEAIEEIKRCSGTQFDPNIAEIFINHIK